MPPTEAPAEVATLAAGLRERFCDCPGRGLPADQHAPAPDGCHGITVAAALVELA